MYAANQRRTTHHHCEVRDLPGLEDPVLSSISALTAWLAQRPSVKLSLLYNLSERGAQSWRNKYNNARPVN